jgi:hypothetical protein
MGQYAVSLEECKRIVIIFLPKNYAKVCPLYVSQFIVHKMEMSPVIPVAPTTQHTPNFMSRNDN